MNQVPAHLAHLAGRNLALAAQSGLGSPQPPHISIKGNRFTLVDAAGTAKQLQTFHMDVVIVDANPGTSKSFYAEAYDPKAEDNKPPTCSSDDGIAPLASSAKVQNPICMTCPNNAWGSATSRITGKDTKACQDQKRVAVKPIDSDIVLLLRIPPGSFGNFGQYVKTVRGNNADLNLIVTRLTFADEAVGILKFAAQNWIDEKTAEAISAIDEQVTGQMVGRIASGAVVAQPLPSPKEEKPSLFQRTEEVHTPQSQAREIDEASESGETAAQSEARTRKPRATKAEMEERRRQEEQRSEQKPPLDMSSRFLEDKGEDEDEDEEAEIRRLVADKRARKHAAQQQSDAFRAQSKPEGSARSGMQDAEPITDDELSRTIEEALNLPVG